VIYEQPTWLYRIWDRDRTVLLYIGISCSWTRRMAEHIADKPWFPVEGAVDFEYYADRVTAREAEATAIRDEHPVHNIQHNRVRITVEIEAEVPEFSPGNIFATAAMVSGGLLLTKWAADFLANWWVQRQGAKQGLQVQVPPVVNPFTRDPLSPTAKFFYLMLAATANAQDNPEIAKLVPGTAWTTLPPAPVAPAPG
jgi:hypothetical protein